MTSESNPNYAVVPLKNAGCAGSEKEKKEKYLDGHIDSHKHRIVIGRTMRRDARLSQNHQAVWPAGRQKYSVKE